MTSVISDLVSSLLAKRGISEPQAIAAFLNPDYDAHTHDPFLMPDMDTAIDRILRAMRDDERIAIYADFDCDGIPGAALLNDLFKKIGYMNTETYIPHRDREGYGFHVSAIDTLKDRGVSVIITVDVGTVAYDAIAHAQSIGIDVIVTDHHEIQHDETGDVRLPDAFAVINPKREPYPFGGLCGTGVAFKLAQALIIAGKRTGDARFTSIPDGWEKWLLDLVAIATVADMVPLIGENRALAYWGLRVLRKSQRPGIDALCNKLRLRKSELTEDDIGFSIAPRVNAASRMGDPELALRLLMTDSKEEAELLAAQLESLNTKRKTTVALIVKAARARARERYAETDRAIVLGDPDWKPTLLGLAANSIMDTYGGLVCMWGRDANGNIKGSCRTDGSVNLMDVFREARDVFDECGGHACSGGFSISHENVHRLPDALAKAVESIGVSADEKGGGADHDSLLTLREAGNGTIRELAQLAPFGIGNPKPVFRFTRVAVMTTRAFGSDKNHIEVTLADRDSGMRMRAFQFFKTEHDFTHRPRSGEMIELLATLERDTFRGASAVALRIVDVLPPRA